MTFFDVRVALTLAFFPSHTIIRSKKKDSNKTLQHPALKINAALAKHEQFC